MRNKAAAGVGLAAAFLRAGCAFYARAAGRRLLLAAKEDPACVYAVIADRPYVFPALFKTHGELSRDAIGSAGWII